MKSSNEKVIDDYEALVALYKIIHNEISLFIE